MGGEDIPLSARLMALADVYDALRSARCYKPAYPHERAKAEIVAGRGGHFDPDVVDAFLALDDEFVTIARSHGE
jgi:response regulator RpfG family c-di-GMP phosphodiesterase